jgi:hypothetical protein
MPRFRQNTTCSWGNRHSQAEESAVCKTGRSRVPQMTSAPIQGMLAPVASDAPPGARIERIQA